MCFLLIIIITALCSVKPQYRVHFDISQYKESTAYCVLHLICGSIFTGHILYLSSPNWLATKYTMILFMKYSLGPT